VFLEFLQLSEQTAFVRVLAAQSHIPRTLVPPFDPQAAVQESVVLTQFPSVSEVSGQVETSLLEQSSVLSFCVKLAVADSYLSIQMHHLLSAKNFLLFPIHEQAVAPASDLELPPHSCQLEDPSTLE